MLTALRLAFRLQRWELVILGLATVAVAGGLVIIAWQMGALQTANPECWAPLDRSVMADCSGPTRAWDDWRILGEIASLGAMIAPFALGLVLGAPLVAREVESRTSGIAWSLSRSRLRWLALRALPIIGFVLVTTTLVSLAGNAFMAERLEGQEPGFGALVPPLPIAVMRGLVVLAIGLAVGALLGRMLPALLVTMGLTGAVFIGLLLVMDAWMATDARPMEVDFHQGGSRIFELGFRDDETGELITLNEYYSDPGTPMTTSEPEGMTMIAWKIPAEEHPVWVARESAVMGGVTVLMGGVLVGVVHRRRP